MMASVAAVVLFLLPRSEVYKTLYKKQAADLQNGMTQFEAQLNYDGMVTQIVGKGEITGLATYESSEVLTEQLLRLRRIYRSCRWIVGMGIVVAIAGFVCLRNQKWYECLRWASYFTVGVTHIIALVVLLSKTLRAFVLQSQYDVMLGADPMLISILPEQWAFYMTLVGLGILLLLGGGYILSFLGCRGLYTPHKFE